MWHHEHHFEEFNGKIRMMIKFHLRYLGLIGRLFVRTGHSPAEENI